MIHSRLDYLVENQYVLSKREIYALWMMTNYEIHRYLMNNVRGEGAEKGLHHWRMSSIIASFITLEDGEFLMRGGDGVTNSRGYAKCLVHDWLAQNLTDHLDEKIGLPLTDVHPLTGKSIYVPYDEFTCKFFEYIVLNFTILMKYVKDNND